MPRKNDCAGSPLRCFCGADGFLRLSLDEILDVRMEHLLSGFVPEPPETARCGTPTSICGFSEWASCSLPRLSLGWDWRLCWMPGVVGFVRVGLPRSNVMLVDRHGVDYVWQRNLEILGTVVDALPWRNDTHVLLHTMSVLQ